MRIGIMQPYFFPYIGYFQLIQAVDVYVNLDHVAFMKASYMTRNTIKNNVKITLPVIKGSQNKSCRQVQVGFDVKSSNSFYKTLSHLYSKEKYYNDVLQQILTIDEAIFTESVSQFNLFFIKKICRYLDIQTQIIESSEGFTSEGRNRGLQDIVKRFNADTYINAIGGQKLYTKEDFALQNIDLKFIKMEDVDFVNPYASILDVLFKYDKDHIKEQLKKYSLI